MGRSSRQIAEDKYDVNKVNEQMLKVMGIKVIKRLFDIIVSVVGLLVSAPVILLIVFQILQKLGLPVLFYQVRPGKNGKLFQMIKFRTMRESIDQDGRLLPDSERLVPLGNFLEILALMNFRGYGTF